MGDALQGRWFAAAIIFNQLSFTLANKHLLCAHFRLTRGL
jgi:hypothetical protein